MMPSTLSSESSYVSAKLFEETGRRQARGETTHGHREMSKEELLGPIPLGDVLLDVRWTGGVYKLPPVSFGADAHSVLYARPGPKVSRETLVINVGTITHIQHPSVAGVVPKSVQHLRPVQIEVDVEGTERDRTIIPD